MVPMSAENGSRLAAVMPSAIEALTRTSGEPGGPVSIVVVIDGLGWHNLQARRGHARTLNSLTGEAVSTVFPSTTGAALTTITTGTLPGQHGLIGYRILDPDAGLRVTLTDWDGIRNPRSWQMERTQFERAQNEGISSYVIARPQHAKSGLTQAILTGAEYVGRDSIGDRFDHARILAHAPAPSLVYLYIDELDRAGHKHGWESDAWLHTLEEVDAHVARLLSHLPAAARVWVTADHGMIDVPHVNHVALDGDPGLLEGVQKVGGEPRLRYLYLSDSTRANMHAQRMQQTLGETAHVFTRDEAVSNGLFGPVRAEVIPRIGDVIVAAQEPVAFYLSSDQSFHGGMIGQHGSDTEFERWVPLLKA